MQINTTYSWKFYTAGVNGKCKCSKCGKTIKKRFTIQYREDSSPDLEYCKEQRDKWEKEEHICLACMKKSLAHPYSVVLNDYDNIKSEIEVVKGQYNEANRQANILGGYLREAYKGKVALDKAGNEYVIERVYDDLINDSVVSMDIKAINKREPWHTKGYIMWISENKIKDYVVTEEVFADRYRKLKEFMEANNEEVSN